MDQTTASAVVDSPASPHRAARGLIRRLYTSNPFYVLSADLVFVGLRMSLDASGRTFEAGALMLALLGYTLLLATTACLLIRFGRVWDDARTLLLLVVAMFLAISVTFDETLAGNPSLGRAFYLGGLLFAVVVSEGLLRGIRLRLPALFRIPYYLVLALFFLYPVALVPHLANPNGPVLRWMLFGFSPIAGLSFLCLLPAIRRGSRYVMNNGSPWPFPLYPWTLFGLLGLAVCGRAYYLCISFHFVGKSDSIFGPYFLVPFLFAINLLLLEAGIVSKRRALQGAALFALPFLLVLSAMGQRPDPIYQGFLALFMNQLGGSPLYLTLIGTTLFAGYAAIRRAPLAIGAMTLSLLALSIVGPRTVDLEGLVWLRPVPLFAVAALEIGLAVRRRDSWKCLCGAACLIAAIAAGLGGTAFHPYQGAIAFHLAILAAILIGTFFNDEIAAMMKFTGAVLLTASCLSSAWMGDSFFRGISPEVLKVYPVLMIATAAAYAYLTGSRIYIASAGVSLGGWLSSAGWQGYSGLRRAIVGLDWIAGGLAFFAIAAIISLGKAGFLAKWIGRIDRKPALPSSGALE